MGSNRRIGGVSGVGIAAGPHSNSNNFGSNYSHNVNYGNSSISTNSNYRNNSNTNNNRNRRGINNVRLGNSNNINNLQSINENSSGIGIGIRSDGSSINLSAMINETEKENAISNSINHKSRIPHRPMNSKTHRSSVNHSLLTQKLKNSNQIGSNINNSNNNNNSMNNNRNNRNSNTNRFGIADSLNNTIGTNNNDDDINRRRTTENSVKIGGIFNDFSNSFKHTNRYDSGTSNQNSIAMNSRNNRFGNNSLSTRITPYNNNSNKNKQQRSTVLGIMGGVTTKVPLPQSAAAELVNDNISESNNSNKENNTNNNNNNNRNNLTTLPMSSVFDTAEQRAKTIRDRNSNNNNSNNNTTSNLDIAAAGGRRGLTLDDLKTPEKDENGNGNSNRNGNRNRNGSGGNNRGSGTRSRIPRKNLSSLRTAQRQTNFRGSGGASSGINGNVNGNRNDTGNGSNANNNNNNSNNNNENSNGTSNLTVARMRGDRERASIDGNENENENDINISNINNRSIVLVRNESEDVLNKCCISVIGFPQQDISYIHKKFSNYGEIVDCTIDKNTINIEYNSEIETDLALSQNGCWIMHDHFEYMICVQYSELIQQRLRNENANGNNEFGDVQGMDDDMYMGNNSNNNNLNSSIWQRQERAQSESSISNDTRRVAQRIPNIRQGNGGLNGLNDNRIRSMADYGSNGQGMPILRRDDSMYTKVVHFLTSGW